MGILNLWRQFGRRYFWSHLLLGVVATGIGMPAILSALSEGQHAQFNTSSVNRQNQAVSAYDNLFAQQSPQRSSSSSSYSVNYWQQHAVRNVIRQLTFAFSTTENDDANQQDEKNNSLLAPQIMLDTLYAMLAQRSLQWNENIALLSNRYIYPLVISYQPAIWIAQVHGIRAGPVLGSS
ncbi:secA translation cis-regulator SecM [Providencia sneebia]|uniref:Secretion monitor n=1 Tax=Providencia sneebia DSM 19967 TaxID=1141660 RepID=K8W5R4_9GAMM|nr:secA translation cis-regulator SecM [Providencia sneebia]EKT55918.1 SecA regulator SecM [Providencia sneebia DSM 19967]